jgi:SlyX protein
MSASDRDQRIEVLESELAFQGETLRALNDAFAVQQQELLALHQQLGALACRLRELGERLEEDAPEPPPPHY